jgi:hypothetical protein
MWIARQLVQSPARPAGKTGRTLPSAEGVTAQGAQEYRGAPLLAPWGVASRPPGGVRCVMLETDVSPVCGGCLTGDESLAEGELRLYSAGGASITLKNDGSVWIEGTVMLNGEPL